MSLDKFDISKISGVHYQLGVLEGCMGRNNKNMV